MSLQIKEMGERKWENQSPAPQLLSTQKMPSAEGVHTAPPQCSYRSSIIATNSEHQHLQCIFSSAQRWFRKLTRALKASLGLWYPDGWVLFGLQHCLIISVLAQGPACTGPKQLTQGNLSSWGDLFISFLRRLWKTQIPLPIYLLYCTFTISQNNFYLQHH